MDIDLKIIESRWQKIWNERKLFTPVGQGEKPKYFNFDSAPFPNGDLHLGHARNYVLGDIVARYYRAKGFDVLYCTNFDSFGLPNELEAEKAKTSAHQFTSNCISRMKQDLKRLGISYDWSRVNSTNDPEYYRWTQWLFLELYSVGLVYRKEVETNWCSNCDTVVANMEVRSGRCARCDSSVEQKIMPQWYIALSEYSEELHSTIDDLKGWSDRARNLLKGFMGKKQGKTISFPVLGGDDALDVFVPIGYRLEDVTFVGISDNWAGTESIYNTFHAKWESILGQLKMASIAVPRRNSQEYSGRTGIDSGVRLKHPSLGIPVPVIFVNYLSGDEGPPVKAGAPACDEADKLLANKLSLSISDNPPLSVGVENIQGEEASYYHVHDWMVSRQKKWGTPMPLINCRQCGYVPVRKEDLPVSVRSTEDAKARITSCPSCCQPAMHVEDTLDCYLDDVWCFLSSELTCKRNFSLEAAGKYGWFPADQYHAGYDTYMYLHLYRFVARFLFKRGYLDTPEPIVIHHGHDMVLQGNSKMSKSHNNSIGVYTLMDEHGADAVRIAITLAANPNKPIRWADEYLVRGKKLLYRVLELGVLFAGKRPERIEDDGYRLPVATRNALKKTSNQLQKTIGKYIEAYRPATCIQYLERYISELHQSVKSVEGESINGEDHRYLEGMLLELCVLLSPFAPHVAEETWAMMDGENLASQASWPDGRGG